jgi:peptidylprolyl isomerase
LIEGFTLGVIGMREGGHRKITIPYHMAYGEAGRPPVIPAKADLIFELEVLFIRPS